ncbi:hypothetical protein [Terrabacter carboxydivorans]|uniref:Uncharacterized protein n=1 Tax=Terrabacter carboxydivorans TaxID=619730 RepID=A0ABP5ZSC0_9MICO
MKINPAPKGEQFVVSDLGAWNLVGKPVQVKYPAAQLKNDDDGPFEGPHEDSDRVQGSYQSGEPLRILCRVQQSDGHDWFQTDEGFVRDDQVVQAIGQALSRPLLNCMERWIRP